MIKRISYLFFILFLMTCGSPGKESSSDKNSKPTEMEGNQESMENKSTILFFGNSITAGYQLDMEQAFPALIQERIDSLGLNYNSINAGLSGETSAGGKSRIGWVLRTVPDIFFLELGANDGLRGLPLNETIKNLQDIIDQVKNENFDVKIIIAGMMVPPNLGTDYSSEFQQMFVNLAENNEAVLIPFVLEGVAGNPELNLSDGIHPTPEGHEIVAETVWEYLQPLL